jgi:Cu/Ag efflux pump CusA
VGNLYEGQKVFDVVVWGVPEIRTNLTDIQELLIDTPTGQVRLEELADVRIVASPVIIRRDAVSRYIDVSANVSGRSLSAVVADVTRGLDEIEIPFEYHVEVLGLSAEQNATNRNILIAAAVAVIGILLLLQACFRSWRLAVIVLLALPVAPAGSMVAILLSGGSVSLGSLFGLVMVLSVAVRNAVMLVGRYRQLEQDRGAVFGPELARRGAGDRLGPVVTTALTAALILLPLVFVGQIAGTEILHPMAVVVLGGLVTSTALNLFILPALYLRFGSSPSPEETMTVPEMGALA